MKKSLLVILIISLLSVTCCKSFRSEKKLESAGKSHSEKACYIDNILGNDNNPGTIKKPIKTIGELNLRLQKTALCIYFSGGQVFDGTLVLNITGIIC